jgi:hypothetical protein
LNKAFDFSYIKTATFNYLYWGNLTTWFTTFIVLEEINEEILNTRYFYSQRNLYTISPKNWLAIKWQSKKIQVTKAIFNSNYSSWISFYKSLTLEQINFFRCFFLKIRFLKQKMINYWKKNFLFTVSLNQKINRYISITCHPYFFDLALIFLGG